MAYAHTYTPSIRVWFSLSNGGAQWEGSDVLFILFILRTDEERRQSLEINQRNSVCFCLRGVDGKTAAVVLKGFILSDRKEG